MDDALMKRFRRHEWKTIIILMVGYALYYFVRKNFSIAIPAMEESLGLSKAQIGIFLTLNGLIYGLSRFVNGLLTDRFSGRKIMAIGLALSAVVNLIICFSPQLDVFINVVDSEGKATLLLVYLIGSLWLINGYVQGMGVPSCTTLLSRWVLPSEAATKISIWNASHSIGAGLIAVFCGFILSRFTYSGWQYCFAIPAIIALLGVPMILFGLKDRPSQAGLPEVVEIDKKKQGKLADEQDRAVLDGSEFKAFVKRMVFRNPLIWILAVANFCIYIIRFTILDWGSSFLTQYKGMDIASAANVVAASEIAGGIIGVILAGRITDRFFHSKAHITCLFCTIGASLSFFLFWKTPESMPWLSVLFIVLSSFFVYGPQGLLGISAVQQATNHASASATGILGVVGYVSQIISGTVFGILAEKSWDSVFLIAIAFGILGSVVLLFMIKAPADGYAKAEKIIQEIRTSPKR